MATTKNTLATLEDPVLCSTGSFAGQLDDKTRFLPLQGAFADRGTSPRGLALRGADSGERPSAGQEVRHLHFFSVKSVVYNWWPSLVQWHMSTLYIAFCRI